MLLDDKHWLAEGFSQRMTVKEWKQMLLDGRDTIIYNGSLRQLKAKKLGGFGIVEISKEPLKNK